MDTMTAKFAKLYFSITATTTKKETKQNAVTTNNQADTIIKFNYKILLNIFS